MTEPSLCPEGRYTPIAQALHWLAALLVFLTVPLAWVMVNMPPKAHLAGRLFTLHESLGLAILTIVAVRLTWRARHPAPPLPGSFARWDAPAEPGLDDGWAHDHVAVHFDASDRSSAV
jgi:cytochrome b561